MSARRLLTATAAVSFALLLTACGGGGTDDAAAEAAPDTAVQESASVEASVEAEVKVSGDGADLVDTAEADAAVTEMMDGLADLASMTGSDVEADIAIAESAYGHLINAIGHLTAAAGIPADVQEEIVASTTAMADAVAEFKSSLEGLLDGAGDGAAVEQAIEAMNNATGGLNLSTEDLAPYTSMTIEEWQQVYADLLAQ